MSRITFMLLTFAFFFALNIQAEVADPAKEIKSLSPLVIISRLDIELPGLEKVKAAESRGARTAALAALLEYYRNVFPLEPIKGALSDKERKTADNFARHIFQWGPYEPADYGDSVNWQWDPRGDIEWVAAIYRFFWALPLSEAWAATRDEKYARAFVELDRDWIARHPLQDRNIAHPIYTDWVGFPWLDIQTGIRATNLCRVFPILVHARAFTPEFLAVFLASIYDHQVKTEFFPMGQVHNKAMMEQRGFTDIASTFREFKDSGRWMALALDRGQESLLAQTTADGVQCELSAGYHLIVLEDAVHIMEQAEKMGLAVPEAYRQRIRLMYDYLFAVATPDLGWAMFGDVSRQLPGGERSSHELYASLLEASRIFGDPKYAARARLDYSNLPQEKSSAFREAGMYVFRDRWGPDQIYLAFHDSPHPCGSGWHDQPDNGTFELYAFGRWLMTDTGFYTYGHDPEKREWHRQTRVHQTLTLDNRNSSVDARARLWQAGADFSSVTVDNNAYEGFLHRRTIWFVDNSFFVLLDEAIGSAPGELALHFQLAEGKAELDGNGKRARTLFPEANVLVWSAPDEPLTLEEEEGWFAWTYGKRVPRKAFCLKSAGQAPQQFVTLIVPYRGTTAPVVSAGLLDNPTVGADRVELEASAFGKTWRIGRDLAAQSAWSREKGK